MIECIQCSTSHLVPRRDFLSIVSARSVCIFLEVSRSALQGVKANLVKNGRFKIKLIWNRQSREANVEFFLHSLLKYIKLNSLFAMIFRAFVHRTCSQLYTCQLYRGTCKRRTADFDRSEVSQVHSR